MEMEEMFKVLRVVIVTVLVCVADGRQKCLTCQFQNANVAGFESAKDRECITAPLNWTAGEIRMRCPSMCTITARFDVETLIPTFFHRGCQATKRESGCVKAGVFWDCIYACGDGVNYCNDATKFKIKDGSFDKNSDDNKDDNNDDDDDDERGDDMAASLYCLIGLIAVCALGYYVKKNWCSTPEEREEEHEEVVNSVADFHHSRY